MNLILVFLCLVLPMCYSLSVSRFTDENDSENGMLYETVDPGEPLFLTPMIEKNNLETARNLSLVNHEEFFGVTSHSGFITVNKQFNSNLFFWYFPAEEDPQNAPLVLWLQGGPGVSSLFGLFIENGPFKILSKNKVSLRKYSWHKKHSLLFIDNPAGTGFSFTNNGGYCTNQTQVGKELYEFLQQFFTLFPDSQTKNFFITSESYGGKFVPAIGYTILKKNPLAKLKINLGGLSIGNGLTDPINQFQYSDHLYQLGLIDANTKEHIKSEEEEVIAHIKNKEFLNATRLREKIVKEFKNISGLHDQYNFLFERDPTKALSKLFSKYIVRNDVRAAIHVGNLPYVYNSREVYNNLEADKAMSVASWVSELLSNYRVLLYSGQMDLLDPYVSMVNYIEHLNFSSASEYKMAERKLWQVNGSLAGYVKVAGNLTEVLVRNAGHMVPHDQPHWAYELIYKFVRNIPL